MTKKKEDHKGISLKNAKIVGGKVIDEKKEFEALMTKATENFNSPNLILRIHSELSQKHLMDDSVKLLTFLICGTSYLDPPKLRQSIALKGSSSVGKDNLIKTCFSHFPFSDSLFLTNATQSAMEDDITEYRMIAYSEFNLGRDDKGANVHLLEILKQLTEGGTSSLKKDLETGFRTTKHSKQEQKTVLYGTAESQDDDQLATRFVIGAVESNEVKITAVNKNTLSSFANKKQPYVNSWISFGIQEFLNKKSKVILPFAVDLPANMFDSQDPRSMRDCKRFMSCVCSIAWFHQLQRKVDKDGCIVGELFDLLVAMIITGDFFNHTYGGLGDQRLQKCLNTINEYLDSQLPNEDNIFNRRIIQEKMKVTTNTIKGYLRGLSNLSIVGFHRKEGNDIFYKRYQKGIKRVLMPINWRELIKHFDAVKGIKISRSTVNVLKNLELLVKKEKKHTFRSVSEKIDTLELTPWDNRSLVWHNCSYPIGDSCCGESPCNEFEGLYYCQKHLKEVQE